MRKLLLYCMAFLISVVFLIGFGLWRGGNPTRSITKWAKTNGVHIDNIECGPHELVSRSRIFACVGRGNEIIVYFTANLQKAEWNKESSELVNFSIARAKFELCEKFILSDQDKKVLRLYREISSPFTASDLMKGFNKPLVIVNPHDNSFCLLTGFAFG